MLVQRSAFTIKPLEGKPGFHIPSTSRATARHPRTHQVALSPSSHLTSTSLWTKASTDELTAEAMRLSAASLIEAGIQNGQGLKNTAPYVNY